MENTLQVHDRILVAKFGGFQRGDVVVFEDPGTGWVQPNPTPTASRGRSSSSACFPTRAQDTSSSAQSACQATTSGSTSRH
ncbi:S26 family signal peptidase [Tessaracoccus flavescens]|uniref:S26 family signal peptidase n=1 Tax=Tessaracoccus flavescens TaxID=399497 RepID=UPI0013747726